MEITATISYEPITLLLPSTFYSRQWLKLIQGGTSDDTAERTRRLLIKSDKKCRWRNDTSPIRTTLPDRLCSKTRDTFTIRLLFSILSRCLSWRCGYVKNEIVLSSFISSSLILTLVTWIGNYHTIGAGSHVKSRSSLFVFIVTYTSRNSEGENPGGNVIESRKLDERHAGRQTGKSSTSGRSF